MNDSTKKMLASAAAVALPALEGAGVARLVRDKPGVVRNALKSLMVGAAAGGTVGGVVGIVDSALDDKAKQPGAMFGWTVSGTGIGAAISLVASLTFDLVHVRARRAR